MRGETAVTLRIDLFGELRARLGDQDLDLGGRRQRAVLAVLLLARGRVVPDDHLIDCVWGGDAVANAAGTLQAYISHLRRRLDPDRTARPTRESRIVRRGVGYALVLDDDAVDAWRFERMLGGAAAVPPEEAASVLTEALELWRGPALAEYADQPWAQPEVARLEGLREVARERLATARLELGDAAVLVPELEAMVAQTPLREERWRLLVLALYRAHRQGDALAALRRARQTLADELGIDPGPALRELEAEVLAQAPTLRTPSPSAAATTTAARPGASAAGRPEPAAPAGAPASAARREAGDLVDRDREVADLDDLITAALGGDGRLVLVEGPAGIGKSRLLAEARGLIASRGAQLLTARGSQLEREFAFGAVRQLFEPVLVDGRRRELALAGAAQAAAGIFDVPGQADGAGDFALLHGLYWLSVNLGTATPLVLLVDDLQWCDPGSVRFLAYLARRIEGLPILVLASLRTGEQHDDAALIAEIQLDPGTVILRPGPLSQPGVAALVRERLGDPADEAFVRACHRTTSGNPLLVRQLLRALESEGVRPDASHADTVTAIGSRAISSIVLMRLRRLPSDAMATAEAMAVLGDGQALPAVAALAELSEARAAAAIGALARAEVVRNEHPLAFVHPLVRDAVYRNIPPGQRELAHERAARVLDGRAAPAEQVAAHLLQIPQRGDEWVVRMLCRAAATANERGAAEGASTYLERALAEPPPAESRVEVLVSLGRTQAGLDGPAAAAHLREAYALTGDPEQRASLAVTLAFALVFTGDRGEATNFAREAAADLSDAHPDERQALLALERIGGYMQMIDPATWRRGPIPEVTGTGPGARMLAATAAWEGVVDGRDRAKSLELARFSIDRVGISVDPGLFWAIGGLVVNLADAETAGFWDEMRASAYASGSLFSVMTTHLWRGFERWRQGDLSEAEQSVETALAQSIAWGPNLGIAYAQSFLLGILLDRGDVPKARMLLDQTEGETRYGDGERHYDLAHARLLIAEDRHREALAMLDRVDGIPTLMPNPVWLSVRRLRAQALLPLGRAEEAVRLLETELAETRRWGAQSFVGSTLRLLGEAPGGPGRPALRDAVEALGGTFARVEYARALLSLARDLLTEENGERSEADALLGQAYAIARECTAGGVLAEVVAAQRRAGFPVAAGPLVTPLTTAERRIARLFVDGADELQIAQQLFLTPRAVRATLTAVADRLGAATLAQLGPRLSAVTG